MRNIQIVGIGVSAGISIGKAYVISRQEALSTGLLLETGEAVDAEIDKFDRSVARSIAEVEELITAGKEALSEEGLEILETQIEFLSDPEIREQVVQKITEDHKNANDAVIEVIAGFVAMFLNMTDEYMRARSADVQDVGDSILKNLELRSTGQSRKPGPGSIVIAQDISPSDTISMDVANVVGFATEIGGRTSHTAIVAKAKGIPAVVGCGEGLGEIRNDDDIILDGASGILIIDPDEATILSYRSRQEGFAQKLNLLKSLKDISAKTIDGFEISLFANISEASDMEQVHENGGEGVGLLRSELLFMGRDSFPSEDEQFEFYKNVAIRSGQKPVTIRTIDTGGDKPLPYLNLPAEQNPFLGYRAIRICLDRKDLFLTQLRAILRAAVYGNVKIMFPMISSVQEIRLAKAILKEAAEALLAENIQCRDAIEVGIMIEIPAAAIMADVLSREVDFFSIGTNDLIQYTLAVDRLNEKVADLYDPYHPAVLRLIANVIEQGHNNNINVAMCGEMASDPIATLLLLGMGLKEFSMSAVAIPAVKELILRSNIDDARKVFEQVKEMATASEIRSFLTAFKV